MTIIVKPDISKIWAETGATIAPPDGKIASGWGYEMMPFEWENWLQNRNDTMLSHINQRGIPEWDAITSYYATKSYVTGSNGLVYFALLDSTNVNPVGDSTGTWVRAFPSLTGGGASGTWSISISGNAATTTKLLTARNINSVAFDGTGDIVVEPYVERDDATNATRYISFVDSSTAGYQRLNMGVNLTYNPSTNVISANISGLSAQATKLATARSISITGDLSWTVNFDGTGNVTGAGTLANTGVAAGTYNNTATAITPYTVDAKGRVTSVGSPVTITPAFASITGKPTTLAGYGITDGATSNSPALTGVPTAPTASQGTNTDQLSTTAFVMNNAVIKDSMTGAAQLPAGTTAQRPANGVGKLRFNNNTLRFEGNNGTAWGSLGGATGGGNDDAFYENTNTITSDYTITAGKNAMSAGPITIADGATVTIPDGSVWTIV